MQENREREKSVRVEGSLLRDHPKQNDLKKSQIDFATCQDLIGNSNISLSTLINKSLNEK
jgi:hypothetical protein